MHPPVRKANSFAVSNFSHDKAPAMLQSLYASAYESGNYRDISSFLDGHASPAAFSDLYEGSR